MQNKKRSFFERLTGSIRAEDYDDEEAADEEPRARAAKREDERGGRQGDREQKGSWINEEPEEAELTVDVYQTATEIVIQAMVAGVKPDDLDLDVARNMITIRGRRDDTRAIDEEDYFTKELYWGNFSRTILLPQEVEPDEADATEKQGLLTVKLKKIDKEKKSSVRVKSI